MPLNEYKQSLFDFCNLSRTAYNLSFTFQNITNGFKRSGLLLLDPAELLSTPRPRRNENNSELIDSAGLVLLLEEKCLLSRRALLGANIQVLKCGYVDTTRGSVLMRADAMRAGRQHASNRTIKNRTTELSEQRRKLKTTQHMAEWHQMTVRFSNERNKRRDALACMYVKHCMDQCGSSETRRAEAKIRTLLKLWVYGEFSKASCRCLVSVVYKLAPSGTWGHGESWQGKCRASASSRA